MCVIAACNESQTVSAINEAVKVHALDAPHLHARIGFFSDDVLFKFLLCILYALSRSDTSAAVCKFPDAMQRYQCGVFV